MKNFLERVKPKRFICSDSVVSEYTVDYVYLVLCPIHTMK